MKYIYALLAAGIFVLVGCEEQGPAERAGENVDEFGQSVQEGAEETGEEMEEGWEDMQADVEEADDEAGTANR